MKTPRQPRPDPAVAVALADMAAETAGLEAAAGGSITGITQMIPSITDSVPDQPAIRNDIKSLSDSDLQPAE